MLLQIDPHTLLRAEERGASFEEIEEVLKTGTIGEAKESRQKKSKVFAFNKERNAGFTSKRKLMLSL